MITILFSTLFSDNLGKQLKLLYVMRDPRALFSPRFAKFVDWRQDDDVAEVCQGIKNDLASLNAFAHSKRLGGLIMMSLDIINHF